MSKNLSTDNSGKPLTELTDFGVKRDGRWLVRHVDMAISSGEIITIVGPNGSGKSTIIKALAGLIKPDEGNVQASRKLSIGYVPQVFSANPAMPITVSRMLNLGQSWPHEKIAKLLQRFQISHLADHDIHSLSGGEYQRMTLARALIRDPDLLLLDEPAKGVDLNGQMDLYEHIRDFRDETNGTVVLVSHDLHLVSAATDRVICLNGHICCSGTPQSVANDPAYKNLFGSEVRNKFAIYRHDHDHVHLADGRVQHRDGSIADHCHDIDDADNKREVSDA